MRAAPLAPSETFRGPTGAPGDAAFAAALALHRDGALERAAAAYQAILAATPDHADALHMLGLIDLQAGRPEAARDRIARALALTPRIAEAHGHLGLALEALDRPAEAEAAFRQAIALAPDATPARLNLANLVARGGRAAEAIRIYRAVLAGDSHSVAAHVNLAGLLARQGDSDGAERHYRAALELAPDDAEAAAGLAALRAGAADAGAQLAEAVAVHRAGRLDAAALLYDGVLRAQPDQPDALHLSGLIAHQRGDADTAIARIRRALDLRPNFPVALSNLGNVLRGLDRRDEAATCYERALALRPSLAAPEVGLAGLSADTGDLDDAARRLEALLTRHAGLAQGWCDLGRVRRRQRRTGEAIAALERAVALEPSSFAARNELGIALHEAGRWDDAVTQYHAALAAEGESAVALRNLGHALKRLGRTAEAVDCYRRAAAHRRPDAAHDVATAARPTYAATSRVKLAHDIDQLAHLAARGWRPDETMALAARYRTVLDDVAACAAPGEAVRLTDAERARLGSGYNRLLHVADAPALAAGPFGAWSPAAIEDKYRAASPELVVVDDFLSAEALASLRRYCLDSTVWFDFSHRDGYLAAFIDDHFDCPLLLQIADALRATLPRVLGPHSLRHLWAYKYDSALAGVGLHGDDAAVNVNFWITPDAANLSPGSGGMTVYPALAPADWRFEDFNGDTPRIEAFLARHGGAPITVPYRANRAVLFDSSLFHETDRFRFDPAYENRRINITMLFGDRVKQT